MDILEIMRFTSIIVICLIIGALFFKGISIFARKSKIINWICSKIIKIISR